MNIILILSDTCRYDNLFGRSAGLPVRTPHIDAFHQRAVSFMRFYTGSFPTVPQRTDMTSGRIGWPWHGWQPLGDSTKNHMPEILGKAGYATQLLCDCPHLFRQGFNRGFDAADVLRGQEGDAGTRAPGAVTDLQDPPSGVECSADRVPNPGAHT